MEELSSFSEKFTMSRSHFILVPVLACFLLLFTGLLNRRAVSSASPALLSGVDPLDVPGTPGGLEFLDAALKTYAPDRVPWIEMTLWQRVQCDDLTYEALGRYLSAPENHLRLDVNVRMGETDGELQIVSDGKVVRCSCRFDREAPAAVREVDLVGSAAPDSASHREKLMQESGCPAIVPLLRNIRERLREPRYAASRWKGHDVVQVTGAWNDAGDNPPGLHTDWRQRPGECRVYLDARTLWPHRIEWWGAPSKQKRKVLLMEIEFREPVLNQPCSAERWAREFTVPASAPPAQPAPVAAARRPLRTPRQ
jgi:hypothetical protein